MMLCSLALKARSHPQGGQCWLHSVSQISPGCPGCQSWHALLRGRCSVRAVGTVEDSGSAFPEAAQGSPGVEEGLV